MYLFRSDENMKMWDALLQFDCQNILIGEFFPGFFYRLPNGLANENVNVLASSLNLVMSWQVLLIGDVNHNQLFFPRSFFLQILSEIRWRVHLFQFHTFLITFIQGAIPCKIFVQFQSKLKLSSWCLTAALISHANLALFHF